MYHHIEGTVMLSFKTQNLSWHKLNDLVLSFYVIDQGQLLIMTGTLGAQPWWARPWCTQRLTHITPTTRKKGPKGVNYQGADGLTPAETDVSRSWSSSCFQNPPPSGLVPSETLESHSQYICLWSWPLQGLVLNQACSVQKGDSQDSE